jgi:hypothetical protein
VRGLEAALEPPDQRGRKTTKYREQINK